jgi:NAD(P)-dependent dehydrogenase (short-subunit alcohol dehydrogenase family)
VDILAGQVGLVTGGGSGLGRLIALKLSREGMKLAVNDIDASRAESVSKEIKNSGGESLSCRADISSKREVEAMFGELENRFNRLDLLVNNAGIFTSDSFLDISEETWDKVMGTNLKGAFLCSQYAARIMKRLGRGRIINISSIAADSIIESEAAYSASKGGLNSLTESMAIDLGPYNITVNAILPGVMDLGMGMGIYRERNVSVKGGVRTPRITTGEDIAALVLFLATDEASYVNGSLIKADGGDSIFRRYGPHESP